MNNSFKGNKSYLPSKFCVVCKKEMTWRKSWEKIGCRLSIALPLVVKKYPRGRLMDLLSYSLL